MAESENECDLAVGQNLEENSMVKAEGNNLIERFPKSDKGNLGFELFKKKTKNGFVYSFNVYWTGAGLLIAIAIIQLVSRYLI